MDITSLVNASRLLPVLRLEEIIKFIRISNLARGTLECGMKDRRQPPDLLPFNILLVLSRVMKLDLATTRTCWSLFKDEIWKQSQDQHEPGLPKDVAEYNEHALLNHTCKLCILVPNTAILKPTSAYRHLFPPTRVCQTAGCIKGGSPENSGVKTLTNPLTYKASLYTMKEGVLPIYTTSLYCRSKSMSFHPRLSLILERQVAIHATIIITGFTKGQIGDIIMLEYRILYRLRCIASWKLRCWSFSP